jgi:glyoxylase-like metal-dependent hydrolase (beta-lactamase superfamily II)
MKKGAGILMGTPIAILDLNFQRQHGAIASYLIRHSGGAVLIESGPGSTISALTSALADRGLTPGDVTHVLLTHIHLDHAGAAGLLAKQGARIIVHPAGAPHLMNPEKLIGSAKRIYGDQMDRLWGEFLPVPEEQVCTPADGEEIAIGALRFVILFMPGHAEHHNVYCFEGTGFTGDVGGVRIQGCKYLRAPMPPPELHFGKWRDSIRRMRAQKFRRIIPTHFGFFEDVDWHWAALERALDVAEKWLEAQMKHEPTLEQLRSAFNAWMAEEAAQAGLDDEALQAFALSNPTGMSADGLLRYWQKWRTPSQPTTRP